MLVDVARRRRGYGKAGEGVGEKAGRGGRALSARRTQGRPGGSESLAGCSRGESRSRPCLRGSAPPPASIRSAAGGGAVSAEMAKRATVTAAVSDGLITSRPRQ